MSMMLMMMTNTKHYRREDGDDAGDAVDYRPAYEWHFSMQKRHSPKPRRIHSLEGSIGDMGGHGGLST